MTDWAVHSVIFMSRSPRPLLWGIMSLRFWARLCYGIFRWLLIGDYSKISVTFAK